MVARTEDRGFAPVKLAEGKPALARCRGTAVHGGGKGFELKVLGCSSRPVRSCHGEPDCQLLDRRLDYTDRRYAQQLAGHHWHIDRIATRPARPRADVPRR